MQFTSIFGHGAENRVWVHRAIFSPCMLTFNITSLQDSPLLYTFQLSTPMFLSMQNRLVRSNCLKSINFTVKSLLAYSAVWVHPWTQNHIRRYAPFGDSLPCDNVRTVDTVPYVRYAIFSLVIIPFQIVADIFIHGALELFHGWRVYDCFVCKV